MKPNLPILCLALCAFLACAPQIHAQNAPAMPAAAAGAARVLLVEENDLAGLAATLARSPSAISLRASEEALETNAAAREALLSYVRGGGIVFLHNGAARLFGFRTVEARQGNNRVAGQLFGRARAALPFGAHPLLWGEAARPGPRTPDFDPTQLPGVNVVFYSMREGDHLVESHPAGTPLLQVSDYVANNSRPLYAAALAPFGRGWAVFTPDSIDQKRGDGAQFARNLLTLLPTSGATLVGVPASAIERGGAAPDALRGALAQAGAGSSSPALPAFGTDAPVPAPRSAPATSELDAAGADARVVLSRAEAGAYAALLGAGGDRAGAAINLLRARMFLSRGEGAAASRAIEAAATLAPGAAEVALWRGVLLAAASQPLNQPSPVRAQLLNDASRALAFAATGASLLPTASANTKTAPRVASPLSAATLRDWSLQMGRISQIFRLEPPRVQQFGTGDAAITVRAFPNDAALSSVLPAVAAFTRSRTGWSGDREEILIFPTTASFTTYRRALGLGNAVVRVPNGAIGDVVGQRIVMQRLPLQRVLRPNPRTGGTRVVPTSGLASTVLARLHTEVLLNVFGEGGTRVPVWLRSGLDNAVVAGITGGILFADNESSLQSLAATGALLTPAQIAARIGQGDSEGAQVARVQAASLVAFFYARYGAGAVVETLQRLGAGQSIDTALQATTGGSELELFRRWRDARLQVG
ncbi:MAG: hypothetical protein KY445_03620 [Armatimonadetes bacterium]|nr:hypothetical protein [Armatimonadota bacterium]